MGDYPPRMQLDGPIGICQSLFVSALAVVAFTPPQVGQGIVRVILQEPIVVSDGLIRL